MNFGVLNAEFKIKGYTSLKGRVLQGYFFWHCLCLLQNGTQFDGPTILFLMPKKARVYLRIKELLAGLKPALFHSSAVHSVSVTRLQNDVQAFCTVLYCAVYTDSSSIASVLTQLKTFEQYRVIVLAGEAQQLCPQPTKPLCSKAFIENWNVYDRSLVGPGKLLSYKESQF